MDENLFPRDWFDTPCHNPNAALSQTVIKRDYSDDEIINYVVGENKKIFRQTGNDIR